MKKIKTFIYAILLMAIIPLSYVQAAEVEVNWLKPEKYTDVKAGQGHRKRFKERTFKAFEQHFKTLAKALPEQQKLVVNVTNVDLAGDVNFNIKRIRVVKDIFIPRMAFNYQLLDAEGAVIKSEEVSLKDMGFLMHNPSLRYRSKPLLYEKAMLDKWFNKTFTP